MKVSFNTCKMFYNNLGPKNARATLKMIKLMDKIGVNPTIGRLDKDIVEIRVQTYPDDWGINSLQSYEYDFGKHILTHYSQAPYPRIDGKFHRTGRETVIPFSDLDLEKINELAK